MEGGKWGGRDERVEIEERRGGSWDRGGERRGRVRDLKHQHLAAPWLLSQSWQCSSDWVPVPGAFQSEVGSIPPDYPVTFALLTTFHPS